jgi:predicted DNA-binding transcriptional regulator YafY
MRASRLLSILMLLQARGRMSAQALAEAVEASVRTVYRDIDELSAAGVPVYAERGRAGGFRLRDGWRTRLTGLTPAEAEAMFLAGVPGAARELGLGDAMASAQLKLLAALPADWPHDAQRVGARFHLDPVDWFRAEPAAADHLPAVADAVWNARRLRIRYESWTGVAEREIGPLGLVLKAGVWYLVAAGAKGGEPRTYRMSAIRSLADTGTGFARPRRFDLARYWADATRRFEAGVYRGSATLRVAPAALPTLRGFSPTVAKAVERSARPPDADGRVEVTIPIESVEHAARELLRLGAHAEVLAPAALRERMLDAVGRLAATYGGAFVHSGA